MPLSSQVRPEYGPTLSQLVGPRVGRLPRRLLIALTLAVVVLVVAAVLFINGSSEPRTTVVVAKPLAFNLVYQPQKLDRVTPAAGQELRLQTKAADDPESVTVAPVRLPAYTGDPSGILPVYASGLIDQMRGAYPKFILRSEGRARVNLQPGYQIQFQTEQGGRTIYGRRALLFEDKPGVRDGADILLLAARSPSIPNYNAVGSNGPTKLPYRSFRLGTERP